MSVTLTLTKRLGALRAADDQSAELLSVIPDNETVRAEITRPTKRSLRHHRMYFGLLNVTAEQIGWSVEQLLTWCKIAVGHCDTVIEPRTGEVHFIPKSIAFARLDQSGFNAFFDASVTAILDRLMPLGTQRDELVDEVMARIGERAAA